MASTLTSCTIVITQCVCEQVHSGGVAVVDKTCCGQEERNAVQLVQKNGWVDDVRTQQGVVVSSELLEYHDMLGT